MVHEELNRKDLLKSISELNHKIEDLEALKDDVQWLEEKLKTRTKDLNERVKELSYLFEVAKMFGASETSIDIKIQTLVDRMPTAWQHPELAGARAIVDGRAFVSGGFAETPWRLTAPIRTPSEAIGSIDVCYREKPPTKTSPLFLREEQHLLAATADLIAGYWSALKLKGKHKPT